MSEIVRHQYSKIARALGLRRPVSIRIDRQRQCRDRRALQHARRRESQSQRSLEMAPSSGPVPQYAHSSIPASRLLILAQAPSRQTCALSTDPPRTAKSRSLLVRHADSGVDCRTAAPPAACDSRCYDETTRSRKFDSVRQQVDQHLPHARWITRIDSGISPSNSISARRSCHGHAPTTL